MNCINIVKKYLEDNNFDGLQNGSVCSCLKDDLVPCNSDFSNCEPGYKVVPPESSNCEYDFFICTEKNCKPWECMK